MHIHVPQSETGSTVFKCHSCSWPIEPDDWVSLHFDLFRDEHIIMHPGCCRALLCRILMDLPFNDPLHSADKLRAVIGQIEIWMHDRFWTDVQNTINEIIFQNNKDANESK